MKAVICLAFVTRFSTTLSQQSCLLQSPEIHTQCIHEVITCFSRAKTVVVFGVLSWLIV